MWLQLIVNLLFQFSLIISFITLFFFTYVKKVEQDIIENQVDTIMNELGNELKTLSPDLVQIIKDSVSKQPEAIDQSIVENNKKLLNNALQFLIPIAGVSIFVSLGLIRFFNLSFRYTLIYSISGLAVIAIVEFMFLHVFARNFRTIDSNAIKKSIVEELIKLNQSFQS
jgi:hypothetical protein